MKSSPYILLTIIFLSQLSASAQIDVLHLKSDVVDTIFSKPVADPYRWMEYYGSDSIRQWLQEQKKLTLAEQKNFSGRMGNIAVDLANHSGYSYTSAEKTGPWYFQMMMAPQRINVSPVLYYKRDIDGHFEEAFNPNTTTDHVTYIQQWALSDSGGFLAVALSTGGSDWLEIKVRNLYKERDLKDRITNVKFSSIVWWRDGFFYARYKNTGTTAALGGQGLYYHKLGDPQEEDKILLATPADKGYSTISFSKSSNGRYLIVNKNQKTGSTWYNVIMYKDLSVGLYDDWKAIAQIPAWSKGFFEVVDYADSGFILKTNYQAPYGRVLHAGLDKVNHFSEIIPATDKVIKEVNFVHHQLVIIYFTKGEFQVYMYNTDGEITHRIKFDPGIEVSGFDGKPDDNETIFYEKTFYIPPIVNRYNFITQKSEPVDVTHIGFDSRDYATQVVSYPSKDGTEISMYLTYKKGTKLKGNNPVILYGYGGFGVPVTPFFNYANILFYDNGGTLAVPMIRGGGELGEEWHEAGMRLNKQNSFDDFVAAAQYLIKEGYTSKGKLALEGGSNGGLLVAAVITQHPEICQVAIAQAGLYDMVRFPKFTGGKYWLSEYGNPDNPTDFENLLSYSPLHNVKLNVNYPATLFIAGKNDDRVVPLHTYKFLATLQEKSAGTNPHILYFEEEAGHNGAIGISAMNKQDAFKLAFIFTEMHLRLK